MYKLGSVYLVLKPSRLLHSSMIGYYVLKWLMISLGPFLFFFGVAALASVAGFFWAGSLVSTSARTGSVWSTASPAIGNSSSCSFFSSGFVSSA